MRAPGTSKRVSRRCLTVLLLAVGIGLSIGSIAAAKQPRRFPQRSPGLSPKSKPVPATSPPASVLRVLQRTQAARYLVLSEASQSGPVRYEVDNVGVRAVTLIDHKISLVEIGAEAYTPAKGKSCYVAAKRPVALLPNIAGTLLPSGIAAIHYVVKGQTIAWTVKTAHGYEPHGTVTVNRAGRIVAATVHSGPGVPLTASVSYPTKPPMIAAPKKLCRSSSKAHRALDR